ncbi:hypothetical protein L9F63_003032, partial [Diploptera punctata]
FQEKNKNYRFSLYTKSFVLNSTLKSSLVKSVRVSIVKNTSNMFSSDRGTNAMQSRPLRKDPLFPSVLRLKSPKGIYTTTLIWVTRISRSTSSSKFTEDLLKYTLAHLL